MTTSPGEQPAAVLGTVTEAPVASSASPFLQGQLDDILEHASAKEVPRAEQSAIAMVTQKVTKMNNDIQQLSRPGQLRLVNLDLDSPRLQQAMKVHGYQRHELEYSRRREHFREGTESAFDPSQKGQLAIVNSMTTIEPADVDDAIISLRFRHYQNRLLDRINQVLRTRKDIKMRQLARDQMQSMFANAKQQQSRFQSTQKLAPAFSQPVFAKSIKQHNQSSLQSSTMKAAPGMSVTREASISMSQLPLLKSNVKARKGSSVVAFNPTAHDTRQGSEAKSAMDAYRSSSAPRGVERSSTKQGGLAGGEAMSQTFSKIPVGRIPPLDKVLCKIKEGQQKQLKVLRAQLQKKDRNQVMMAMRQFKEKRASETAKEIIEDKMQRIKDRNEVKFSKVAQRKAVIEVQKKKKRNQLYEKEQHEMSPVMGQMLRTFNASTMLLSASDMQSLSKMRSSVPALALPNNASSMRSPDDRSTVITPQNKKAGRPSVDKYALAQQSALDFTESKMEARDRQEVEMIEPMLRSIEAKLAHKSSKKDENLRSKQNNLKYQLDMKAYRVHSWKLSEEEKMEERRKKLETIKRERTKRIKHELEEQTDNYLEYKWQKDHKRAQFEKRKLYQNMQEEQRHKALEEKIQMAEVNLDYHRDDQKKNQLIKQEMRKLKEQDLQELQTQQKRVKHMKKVNLASKKIHLDEIKNSETSMRHQFMQRVQDQNQQCIKEMATLKDALSDYLNENYNRGAQGQFLKQTEGTVGIGLPLKEDQIKVAQRDQVLIKKKSEKQTQSERMLYGNQKKDNIKEYDLKTNQLVEVRKRKRHYGSDSDD